METSYEQWELKDFILFLLIHAAASDLEISIEEEEHIIEKYSREKFDEMVEFHKNQTDFDNMLIIHYLKDEILKTDEEKSDLYDKVEELFKADGSYSAEEKNLMIALKTILD